MTQLRYAATQMAANLPGLQAERTGLSWTRTGLGFLANGALLLARSGLSEPGVIHRAAVVIAFLLALSTVLIAHRRRRTLAQRPLPTALAAPVSLLGLGIGTMCFGLVILAVICTR